jgi:hypothetical protein
MPGMEHERKSGWTVGIVVALVLLPLLYAPSVGPAVWLHQRGLIPDAMSYVYSPLEWAAHKSPHFESVLIWYVTLWEPESAAPAPAMPAGAPTPVPPPALPSPAPAVY